VSYFSPRNIFILGDYGPRSSFPNLATFFLWQFPFYLYGLHFLIKRKDLGELHFITMVLLLISPIPAAVTRDPYSTIRSLQMVIPLLIIISLGILNFYEKLKGLSVVKRKVFNFRLFNITFAGISFLIVIYSLGKLYSSVIILNEYHRAEDWNFGFENVADIIKAIDPNISIVVDNSRTEPYSQLLFFLKFDPLTYQNENFEVPLNEYYTNLERNKTKKIGNVITRPIDWEKDLQSVQYLVGDSLAISYEQIEEHKLTLVDEVKFPDGRVAFRIVKTPGEK